MLSQVSAGIEVGTLGTNENTVNDTVPNENNIVDLPQGSGEPYHKPQGSGEPYHKPQGSSEPYHKPQGSPEPYHKLQGSSPRNSTSSNSSDHSSNSSSESSNHSTDTEDSFYQKITLPRTHIPPKDVHLFFSNDKITADEELIPNHSELYKRHENKSVMGSCCVPVKNRCNQCFCISSFHFLMQIHGLGQLIQRTFLNTKIKCSTLIDKRPYLFSFYLTGAIMKKAARDHITKEKQKRTMIGNLSVQSILFPLNI